MVSQVKAEDSSARVLDATRSLIIDGGPGAVSVSAIANRAGVSRMTVYRKFDDRQAVLAALFNRELGSIVAEAFTDRPGTQRERIADSMVLAVQRINEHPLMQAVLRHEPEVLTEWVTQRLGATQRLARQLLAEQISAGQTPSGDGSVRAGDADEMALSLVLVAQAFVFAHRIGGDPGQLRPLVNGYLA